LENEAREPKGVFTILFWSLAYIQAGCFATELKSNNCKLTKWLMQAHLAGVPNLKIGWVSRYDWQGFFYFLFFW
jgi:hypothetical protein